MHVGASATRWVPGFPYDASHCKIMTTVIIRRVSREDYRMLILLPWGRPAESLSRQSLVSGLWLDLKPRSGFPEEKKTEANNGVD